MKWHFSAKKTKGWSHRLEIRHIVVIRSVELGSIKNLGYRWIYNGLLWLLELLAELTLSMKKCHHWIVWFSIDLYING